MFSMYTFSSHQFCAQCFIRCYLDAVGILKDDELNREVASQMQWATSEGKYFTFILCIHS